MQIIHINSILFKLSYIDALFNDEKSYDWQKRNLKAALDKEPIEAIEENVVKTLKSL